MVASCLKHLYSLGYQRTGSVPLIYLRTKHPKHQLILVQPFAWKKLHSTTGCCSLPQGEPRNAWEASGSLGGSMKFTGSCLGMIKEMHRIYFFLRVSILRYGKCILYIHVKCPGNGIFGMALKCISNSWICQFRGLECRSIFWQIKRNTAMI